MNAITTIAGFALLFAASAVPAQEPQTTLPAVEASAIRHTFDCEKRSLPSQREVGEWTGQHNFAQVYDTRERLMAEVGRSCQKAGVGQVNLVIERRQVPDARDARWVASIAPAKR